MTVHFDALEKQDAAAREVDLLSRLPALVRKAMHLPGWKRHLGAIDPSKVNARAALATLPVLRKSDLPAMQKADPPFAGFIGDTSDDGRLFVSPGPIFEAESREPDVWRCARAMFAAGFRKGDIVLNTFSYHLTPGGFVMDSGARALGCPVIPAGPGNTEQQLEVIQQLRPVAYAGTPDFLKIILDKAQETGKDVSSLKKAFVSGGAFTPSLRELFASKGITAYQCYATADVGVIAYETPAREGMIVNEDVILEIVRPGTGDPVSEGEVGEIVVTSFNMHHPMIRLALGDLSAFLPGGSPCGRTGLRIKGWMGRADQTAKVKGMFVRPEQIAEIGKRHPELKKLRLVITRANDQDMMTLRAEATDCNDAFVEALGESVKAITKLSGKIELVVPGSLPNDGKVIADERPVG
jgi:phenylacetate-CoA ligase